MLYCIGGEEADVRLDETIFTVIGERKVPTYVMGGTRVTLEAAEAIAECIQVEPCHLVGWRQAVCGDFFLTAGSPM